MAKAPLGKCPECWALSPGMHSKAAGEQTQSGWTFLCSNGHTWQLDFDAELAKMERGAKAAFTRKLGNGKVKIDIGGYQDDPLFGVGTTGVWAPVGNLPYIEGCQGREKGALTPVLTLHDWQRGVQGWSEADTNTLRRQSEGVAYLQYGKTC